MGVWEVHDAGSGALTGGGQGRAGAGNSPRPQTEGLGAHGVGETPFRGP